MLLSILLFINAEMPAYFGPVKFNENNAYLKTGAKNSHIAAFAKDFTHAKSYMDTLEDTKSLMLNMDDKELKSLGIDGGLCLEGKGWLFQHSGQRTFLAVVKKTWKEIGNLTGMLKSFVDLYKSPLLKSAQPVPEKDIQVAELIQKEKENTRKIAELEAQGIQKEAKLAELERKTIHLETQAQQKSREVQENQAKCMQKEAEIQAVNQQLKDITARLTAEKEAGHTKNEAEQNELKRQRDNLNTEKQSLIKKQQELNDQKEILEVQNNTFKEDKNYLENQLNPIIEELYNLKIQQQQLLTFWSALIDSTTAPSILEPKEVKTWECLHQKIDTWANTRTDFVIKYEITSEKIHDLYWNYIEKSGQIADTDHAAPHIFYASQPVKGQLADYAQRAECQNKLFAFSYQVIHQSTKGVVTPEDITTFKELKNGIGLWVDYGKPCYIDAPFIQQLYITTKQNPYAQQKNGINDWLQGLQAGQALQEDDVESLKPISLPDSCASYEIV